MISHDQMNRAEVIEQLRHARETSEGALEVPKLSSAF